MKTITIGQVAIACFSHKEVTNGDSERFEADSVIYEGFAKRLTREAAEKFAPLHPRFRKYFDDAAMVLWKGKGKFATGTEDPVWAAQSLLPKGTEYIVVFQGITQ